MQKLISIYIICFLLISACADSDLITPQNQILRIQILQNQVASNNFLSNSKLLQKAKKIIASTPSIPDSIKAENNYLFGQYFRANGNLDSAAIYFNNATAFVKNTITNNRERDFFYESWYAYKGLRQYGDCLAITEHFKSMIDIENDLESLSYYYFFRANTYKSLKNYKKAHSENDLRIKALEINNDTLGLVRAKIAKAEFKFYLGFPEETFKILDELISNINTFKITYDHKRQLFGDYGVYLYYDKQYAKAIEYYNLALENTKKIEARSDKNTLLATLYGNIAEAHLELNQYELAQTNLDSISSIGINNINRRIQKSTLKYKLRLANKTDKKIDQVLNDLNKIFDYQDITYAEKYNKELVALTKAVEKEKILLQEKRKSEIKNLRLKSWFLFALFLLAILIVFGFLFYRQRKFKFDKQNLQMHQRLLRSQMNPHFTFNTLYAIQNLIKKEPEKSNKYLLKFSRLLRLILDNSISNYVQIDKEIESLRKYMDLQLLRFPNKFEYEFILNGMQEDDLFFIPPMLLQPFVENSIEHGFASIDYLGIITIELTLEKQFIQCTISDNGKGLLPQLQNKKSTSTLLISNFIEKSTKSKISIVNKINVNPHESGLITKFSIPYKLSNHD